MGPGGPINSDEIALRNFSGLRTGNNNNNQYGVIGGKNLKQKIGIVNQSRRSAKPQSGSHYYSRKIFSQ